MQEPDNETTESLLRQAFDQTAQGDQTIDLEPLRHRAHRELQARDLVGFGFSHLLASIAVLLNGLCAAFQRSNE